ncbi:MAG: UDP-N-acetylglucosamine 4,6-dehydratase (inverting) [Verrucomicrobia bacterium]|nr:UDP-N-acetylglucosamine 4,6-dehydratase (inverting) [Verrucomicrobiota bacterium]
MNDYEFLNGKRILITGGTGSLGKTLAQKILNNTSESRVVVFSRDEFKQFEMRNSIAPEFTNRIRFFIGDVRDEERLKRAMAGVNCVFHTAALKQIDTAEYNPEECIRTNVDGAKNVINAAIEEGVSDVVALSTDKACAPVNLYGASKLVSDKLFVAANNIKGKHNIRFSVVRYGNVMGSRGSVIPFFLKKRQDGVIPITDTKMTRFNISLDESAALVIYAARHHLGGEIFVPKIPSYRILDVAEAVAPSCRIEVIGIRPGEKLHEEMITQTDALNTIDLGTHYAILPAVSFNYTREQYFTHHKGNGVTEDFSYNSGNNCVWETVESICEKIRQHIDPKFTPK